MICSSQQVSRFFEVGVALVLPPVVGIYKMITNAIKYNQAENEMQEIAKKIATVSNNEMIAASASNYDGKLFEKMESRKEFWIGFGEFFWLPGMAILGVKAIWDKLFTKLDETDKSATEKKAIADIEMRIKLIDSQFSQQSKLLITALWKEMLKCILLEEGTTRFEEIKAEVEQAEGKLDWDFDVHKDRLGYEASIKLFKLEKALELGDVSGRSEGLGYVGEIYEVIKSGNNAMKSGEMSTVELLRASKLDESEKVNLEAHVVVEKNVFSKTVSQYVLDLQELIDQRKGLSLILTKNKGIVQERSNNNLLV